MINLGLAGAAGSGKDTAAEYLVAHYGFLKYSFSDALYREVTAAFWLEDESQLRQRETKELNDARLSLDRCYDREFCKVVRRLHEYRGGWNSPRQILQWWGTEYRRAQDPDYWIKAAGQWIHDVWCSVQYPEHRPQFFVNTSVRFPNEQAWIHEFEHGNVWHLRRDAAAPVAGHVSETPLPVLEGERELWNNDTIERLEHGIDLLLSTSAKFVRVEPMQPDAPPDTRTEDEVAAEINYAKGH